jgi:hypothetical protein
MSPSDDELHEARMEMGQGIMLLQDALICEEGIETADGVRESLDRFAGTLRDAGLDDRVIAATIGGLTGTYIANLMSVGE